MQGNIRKYRLLVQSGFLLFILYLGFRFHGFVRHFDSRGNAAFVPHPDGVEGFLPIGGLTNLKYWLATGTIHPYHPAAMFILVGAVLASAALKKGFCGWVCPVGFLSERLYEPWKKHFKKNVRPPTWLDWPLRGLKYLLLAFFLWAILLKMDAPAAKAFLDGDYWKVADVKMLKFFTEISPLALGVISALVLLSLPIRNFWCRYLCPYGALLGLVGLLSPARITRDDGKCIHCRKCTRNCPAYLPVEAKARIVTPECTSCMTCLSGCPKGAIYYSAPGGAFTVPARLYPPLLLFVFLGVVAAAKLSGHWHSGVSSDDLMRLVPMAKSLVHP